MTTPPGPVILVIGRNNQDKHSDAIARLLALLHGHGYQIIHYESVLTRAKAKLEGQLRALLPMSYASYLDRQGLAPSLLRKGLKGLLALTQPSMWPVMIHWREERHHMSTRLLKASIDQLGAQPVYLLTHSAGGIAASVIANEVHIAGLICFGYPFKHPDLPEEPRRTKHLSKVNKAFLVIQGNRDEYGCSEAARRYSLSPSTTVLGIDANHDYNDLTDVEFNRVYKAILRFLGRKSR